MESVDDAACLLLSLSSGSDGESSHKKTVRKRSKPLDGEFECKTCNRRFPSFQALGGHRTGHKRAKIINIHDNILHRSSSIYHDVEKPMLVRKKHLHQCTICGEGFSMGQALGGHMRRHRADPIDIITSSLNIPLPSLEECGRSGEILALPRNTSHIRLLELFV